MKTKKKEPVIYIILKPIACFFFRIIMFPKVSCNSNIPKNGRVVLAGNHTKSLDCFMVMMSTGRCIHFLAKSDIFKPGFLNMFFHSAGLIPVHRERKDPDALRSAKEYLNEDRVIGIFPEGRTNKTDEEILPLKMGAVKMASDTESPIVPFAIKGKYIPFCSKIEIKFGEPYYLTEDLETENIKLREKIREVLHSM